MLKTIIKRSGEKVAFDASKIRSAIFKANVRNATEKMSEQQLDKLTQQGLVHKVTTEEGALYQYCPQAGHSHDCFLLRCEGCGRMVHLDCRHLEEVCRHLSSEHHFRIDPRRTVLTGLCDHCQEAKHEG